jgi:adenosylhomocysteine nucleosidase
MMVQSAMEASESLGLKCHIGRIITGEAFITEFERDKLIQSFQPLCVDMESASVAHVCYANSIPFIAIRSGSDFANESGLETFENNVEASSLSSLRLVEKLICGYRTRPTRG